MRRLAALATLIAAALLLAPAAAQVAPSIAIHLGSTSFYADVYYLVPLTASKVEATVGYYVSPPHPKVYAVLLTTSGTRKPLRVEYTVPATVEPRLYPFTASLSVQPGGECLLTLRSPGLYAAARCANTFLRLTYPLEFVWAATGRKDVRATSFILAVTNVTYEPGALLRLKLVPVTTTVAFSATDWYKLLISTLVALNLNGNVTLNRSGGYFEVTLYLGSAAYPARAENITLPVGFTYTLSLAYSERMLTATGSASGSLIVTSTNATAAVATSEVVAADLALLPLLVAARSVNGASVYASAALRDVVFALTPLFANAYASLQLVPLVSRANPIVLDGVRVYANPIPGLMETSSVYAGEVSGVYTAEGQLLSMDLTAGNGTLVAVNITSLASGKALASLVASRWVKPALEEAARRAASVLAAATGSYAAKLGAQLGDVGRIAGEYYASIVAGAPVSSYVFVPEPPTTPLVASAAPVAPLPLVLTVLVALEAALVALLARLAG